MKIQIEEGAERAWFGRGEVEVKADGDRGDGAEGDDVVEGLGIEFWRARKDEVSEDGAAEGEVFA